MRRIIAFQCSNVFTAAQRRRGKKYRKFFVARISYLDAQPLVSFRKIKIRVENTSWFPAYAGELCVAGLASGIIFVVTRCCLLVDSRVRRVRKFRYVERYCICSGFYVAPCENRGAKLDMETSERRAFRNTKIFAAET